LKKSFKAFAAVALIAIAGTSVGQPLTSPVPQNIIQLTANGTVEIQQDLLSVTLSTMREGSDPSAVQGQLKHAVDAALVEAKRQEKAGAMDVRTGNFSLTPTWGRDGKTTGWQGRAEVVLEGQDFARITATAGKVQTLTVSQLNFGLSRAQRDKSERDAQDMAIKAFKARAAEISSGFGFSGFSLREVSVNVSDQGNGPRPRMLAMEARSSAQGSPLPVDAGNSTIVVSVSGSVQLK
jgi:predicted secreted protein